MSDPRDTNHEERPAAPAETARQEGAQSRIGKPPSYMLSDGAMDVSDPKLEAEITDIADQVHANA